MDEQSPLQQAQTNFINRIPLRSLASEDVGLAHSLGRTAYADIKAPEDMPPYPRAIVEGYLVKASATAGASEQSPNVFSVVGAIEPGDESYPVIGDNEALRVVTGSIVPNAGYAIVRMWEAKQLASNQIAASREFAPNFFIETQGCDVKQGTSIIPAGTTIGPWQIALLASLGITSVKVSKKPQVAVFASGNEVIAANEKMRAGAIRDCNSPMLAAAITQAGGEGKTYGIISDDFDLFLAKLKKALAETDMVVISGGTAIGGRDFVSDLIREAGELIVDGVQMRSGRPLIMGVANDKPIVAVAGHPPEALRGFKLFGVAALDRLLGRDLPIPEDK